MHILPSYMFAFQMVSNVCVQLKSKARTLMYILAKVQLNIIFIELSLKTFERFETFQSLSKYLQLQGR